MTTVAETCPMVDPGGRSDASEAPPAPGLGTLDGRRLAVLDIAKVGSDAFVDQVDSTLRAHAAAVEIERGIAPPSRGMPEDELAAISVGCDGAVLALADCGTCSSWTLLDAIELNRRGCRAVLVTTEALRPTIDALAGRLGMSALPVVEVALPNREQTRDEVTATALAAGPQIVDALLR
jgi:hypothetical protein